MLVVFPFHAGDEAQLQNLLVFIRELGGAHEFAAVLVADAGVSWQSAVKLQKRAGQSFSKVDLVVNDGPVQGWPQGPNSLFAAAAQYCQTHKAGPWLWMETDCVPMVNNWAAQLAAEYHKADVPFLGHVYDCHQPNLPAQLMSGVALYPANAWSRLQHALSNPNVAFDVAMTKHVMVSGKHTSLIQHLWGEPNLPPSFPKVPRERHEFGLEKLQAGAVLFHRNKDGSLIGRLRERLGFRPMVLPVQEGPRGTISVRRTAAIGDVLASTVVATKLYEQSYDVVFQAHSSTHCVLRRVVPPIKAIVEPGGNVQVNLDGAYETNPRRRELHFAEMFVQRANEQMTLRINARNFAPRMKLDAADDCAAQALMGKYPRPWTIVVPRSNAWINRTVPDNIWNEAARHIPGTKFWLATYAASSDTFIDLGCRHFDLAIACLGHADLVVSVDTGPMHVAAALGTPVLAIEQSSSPELHLSDQQDWQMVQPNLTCLNCQQPGCPLPGGAHHPPCQNISPQVIAKGAVDRLNVRRDGVGAVVAIYKPSADKLNHCLRDVLPQVDEVVVTLDAGSVVPHGVMQHAKLRFVRMKAKDVGYGRKANFGARHTNQRYLLFLNDDCYLAPDAVARMREVMDVDVGMVSHLLRYPDGTIQHGGTYRPPGVPGWGHLDHRARESRIKAPVEMENVCGASVLVRRQAFYEAGGFDEDFYLYCEDNALCLAVRRAGWRIMYTPHASGVHDESQSTSVTQNIHQIMQASNALLKQKWGWYFDLNKNNELGVFE